MNKEANKFMLTTGAIFAIVIILFIALSETVPTIIRGIAVVVIILFLIAMGIMHFMSKKRD